MEIISLCITKISEIEVTAQAQSVQTDIVYFTWTTHYALVTMCPIDLISRLSLQGTSISGSKTARTIKNKYLT